LQRKGQRYCSIGNHQVSVEGCTSIDSTLRATCRARLTRRRDERHAALEAAASAAVLRDHELRAEQTLHNGDTEGVEATKIDKFDNTFGDGTDLMNVDLPDDSALS
jgi:hypothetical protein